MLWYNLIISLDRRTSNGPTPLDIEISKRGGKGRFEKFNFIKSKYYGRILCKMQKEAGDVGRERGCDERKGRSKEKGDDRDLSQVRNQDVQNFGESPIIEDFRKSFTPRQNIFWRGLFSGKMESKRINPLFHLRFLRKLS